MSFPPAEYLDRLAARSRAVYAAAPLGEEIRSHNFAVMKQRRAGSDGGAYRNLITELEQRVTHEATAAEWDDLAARLAAQFQQLGS